MIIAMFNLKAFGTCSFGTCFLFIYLFVMNELERIVDRNTIRCVQTLNRQLFPALLVVLDDLREQVPDSFQVDAAQWVICSASLLVIRTPTTVSLYWLHHRGRAPTRQTAPQQQITPRLSSLNQTPLPWWTHDLHLTLTCGHPQIWQLPLWED